MSVSDDEKILHNLEAEKAAIESSSHSGYADASRYARLESEIEAVQRRIAREGQHPGPGEG